MKPKPTTYKDSGVLTNEELGLAALLRWVRPTEDHRRGRIGRQALDIGYFANVIDIGHGVGLAMTCDGVGTKILVAELLGRFDTIGIDCVAMNVNDLICVGAEPVSMLDYIAVERADPAVLEAIGRGLAEGARQAGVNIVGGEIAQLREMIRGAREGGGIDLVGMCVGTVPLDRINTGRDVRPGDVIVGLSSSGVHSNGLTLARRALLEGTDLRLDTRVAELGRTVGEELLEPTRIYVGLTRELARRELPIKAMTHVTSDGLMNLARIEAPSVGFEVDALPPAPPIFRLIQERGPVSDAEMYAVFNMGIGFCLIVPDDAGVVRAVSDVAREHGVEAFAIGRTIEDPERRVLIREKGLVGKDDRFLPAS